MPAGRDLGTRPESLFDLPPGTRAVYLNFAPINVLEVRHANDRRNPSLFPPATHGTKSSIFVLTAYPGNFEGHDLPHYIVPSSALNTAQRYELNEACKSEGWSSTIRMAMPLLDEAVLIDGYSVLESEIPGWFRRLFAGQKPQGSANWDLGHMIYITTLKEVFEMYLDVRVRE